MASASWELLYQQPLKLQPACRIVPTDLGYGDMCNSLTFAVQALLVRHEQYMYDAERNRSEMKVKIEKLELDKRELEEHNAATIAENRSLLDQLEDLNGTIAESDTHIKSLEATLQSTRQEVRRLETLASRTHDLEMQLAQLEEEQEELQRTVVTSQEEERCAIGRWRAAERKLGDIQDQLERIEREASEEKERHVEIVGRMGRQRAVEKELNTAAGRLKSAASATAGNGKGHVVSHFVKDILQDNANLQMGIVELREMLMNSNDEVQLLREQLMMHQPMPENDGDGQATLRAETAPKEEAQQVISQALHIHHHYHAPKKDDTRRPKKKRTSLNSTLFTPPRTISTPKTPRSLDTSTTILKQTSVSIPSPITANNRWSAQSGQMSDFAPSSVPSSPQSVFRHSAMFDRGFDIDSSRPTSPGSSIDPMSPQFPPYRHRKRNSEASTRSFAALTTFQPHVIHEERDDDVEELPLHEAGSTPSMPSLEDGFTPSDTSHEFFDPSSTEWDHGFHPSLRSSTSHESILSISGIDIHTLKSRPSQIIVTGSNTLLRPRSRLGTSSTTMSMETITGPSLITARPMMSRQGHNSSSYLRSVSGTLRGSYNSDARSVSSSGSNSTDGPQSSVSNKLGGWVFGRWGASPKTSTSTSHLNPAQAQHRAVSTGSGIETPSKHGGEVDPLRALMGRPPGINQKGPIPGFVKKIDRAPSQVKAVVVDHDALKAVLEGDD